MDEKQFKQLAHDLVVNIASTMGTFATGLELTDDDLVKTQKLVKKFDDTLTEFIDSRKPKFEVGDYIVNKDGGAKWIGEIIEVDGQRTTCNWYDVSMNKIRTNTSLWDKNSVHATTEEIAEYKAALNFRERGRKPFEVKEDDLIINALTKNSFFVKDTANWSKRDFTSSDYKLLKTAEELEEWLGTADE